MFLYTRIRCNNNETIEDNIYLFINWFHFNLLHAGYSHFFEVETHLSLAKKIEFQLKTNLGNAPNFVLSYLKNELFSDTDLLFDKYDLCIDLRDAIQDIHNGTHTKGKHIRSIVEGECFQNEIDDLLYELESDYLNDILDNLHELLEDKNLFPDRFDELKYFTKLIVSHFLLKGYSHLDLEESFLIAANVSPKIGVEGKNFEIEIQSIDEVIDYFKGLESAPENSYTFYLPIRGIEFQEDETLRYNEVEFFSVMNTEISDLLHKTKEKYSNWLVDIGDDKVFCKATFKAKSLSSAKDQALSIFRSELSYLNIALNTDGKLNGEFFIGTEDGEEFTNFFISKINEVGQFGVEVFKNNPFEFYRQNLTNAKERIKRFEPYFINSISEPSHERKISSLWHYLEVLFYQWKKENTLKTNISCLLLLNENSFNLKEQINEDVFELLKEERHWELGINDFETQGRLGQLTQIDTAVFRSEIENPFIQILIDEYERFGVQDNLIKSQDYYYRMIDEAYCVRNSFLHSGEVSDLSVIKLKYVFPFLISRIRDLIHSEIEREDSFENIAEHLYTVGKAMI